MSSLRPARFLPLDGMRAIAAGCVALYHFQQRVPHLDARIPRFVSLALQHGNLGVQIFFVLSGFAVARSLSATNIDPPALGRFMLRRSIRLDPPYAFVVLLVTFLALRNPGGWPVPPTVKLVVAHLFYLQGILGMLHLQGVFWTLCIEIQLYLAFGILLGLGQRARLGEQVFGAVVGVTALSAAALTWATPFTSTHLLPYWPVFCLGVLVERADRIPAARVWLFSLVCAFCVAELWHFQLEAAAGLFTVAILHLATKASWLARGLSSRPLLALGRGSYSFYLLHALVGGVVFEATVPRTPTAWSDFVRVTLALLVSGLAAYALHHAIELPAQRLSRRVGGA
ncbi:MAG: acyltransferase family protein [Polyangiales bacterium]